MEEPRRAAGQAGSNVGEQMMDIERNVHDWHRLTGGAYKKPYFQLDPRNPKRYRTVHWRYEIFANKPVAMFSNFVEGTPPEGMDQLPPNMLQAANRFGANSGRFY